MKEIWVAVSLLALTACGQSTEESGGAEASEVLPASSQSVTASSLTKPQLAGCLTDWKEVANQGCVALSGAQMSDDQTLVPSYRQAVAELKRRCPSPSRIEWVAEQASREALAGFDSWAAVGEPPTLPELCETSVTFRGNSEGYDRRVWDPHGLKLENERAQAQAVARAERQAIKNERDARRIRTEETPKIAGQLMIGDLGPWGCVAIDDSPLSVVIRETKATSNHIGLIYRDNAYRGDFVGGGFGWIARVRNATEQMEVEIIFGDVLEVRETNQFTLSATAHAKGASASMLCELLD